MEEWKECRLTEIMDLIGGGTPKTSNPDYWDGDIPWISVKDFNGERRYVGDTEKKITKLGLENSSTKILSKGDIIISARGTVGELAIIPSDMAFNQSCYGLRAKDFVDSCFLYYLLKQSVNILKHNTHGSVFDTITRETFENISVKLPPLPTQQKIASILSSLDEKIELNNKINTNLEQQAGALFKNWFVDFEPFGGKMPEGWKVGKLSELINVKYGKDHKKLDDGNYPVYGSGGIMRYVDQFLYDKESVLIPRKGTLNNVFYINEPFWSVDTMFYTEMKKENIAKYVYFFVKGKDLNSMNAGSAVPSMTTEILNAIEVVIPSDEYLKKFENIVSPMFKQIKQCITENENLASIRDTLLPKLMNGEIETNSNIINKR